MLIDRHIDAIARTAYSNARIAIARLNRFGQLMSKICIVSRFATISAKVYVMKSLACKPAWSLAKPIGLTDSPNSDWLSVFI